MRLISLVAKLGSSPVEVAIADWMAGGAVEKSG